MSMIAIPRSCCSLRRRSRICACVVTSSAVVGSSAMRRRGSQDSATAIIARWRSPPESSNEYSSMRRSGFGMPTLRSASIPRQSRLLLADRVVEEDRLDDLRADRVHGTEGGHRLLEDEADVAASNRAYLAAVGLELDQVDFRSVRAREDDLAFDDSAGTIDDAQDRLRRDALAAAALADDAERLSREDVEGRAVDGLGRSLVLEEAGLQVPHRQERLRVIRHRARLQIRIRRVADAVAHEIEREDRDDDARRTGSEATAR